MGESVPDDRLSKTIRNGLIISSRLDTIYPSGSEVFGNRLVVSSGNPGVGRFPVAVNHTDLQSPIDETDNGHFTLPADRFSNSG
jgi:hypothetical protein